MRLVCTFIEKKKKRANKTGMKNNTQEQSSHTRKQEK